MPLWDFKCAQCNIIVEMGFASLRDAEGARCPHCHGEVTRLPASGGFVIKGFNAKNNYSRG